MLFADLPCLAPESQTVLQGLGLVSLTPVQEATIPLFCGNKDVAVQACTGSGKTLAFVLPVVERLRRLQAPLRTNQVGAIIISPTRELASQTMQVANPFIATVPWLTTLLLVGGTDVTADVRSFHEFGGHVLIGTPGRLSDFMQRSSSIDFRTVEVLVLDEADRLLDMGFQAQLDSIMRRLPRQRRTGLFSATQTEAVDALARAGLRNPVRINVVAQHRQDAQGLAGSSGSLQESRMPSALHMQYIVCDATQKLPQLVAFLQEHQARKTIVYFLTCACVDFYSAVFSQLFEKNMPRTWSLHGRMKQAARNATMGSFKAASAGVLLCTDIAARGLDIPNVHWVVQFDPPQDPSAFVHRVGRTARMGRSGNAVVYLLPHESTYVEFLKVRNIQMEPATTTTSVPDLPLSIQRLAESDRLVMELGVKAFVSYVRAYKEHHCKYIFRLQDLSLGHLATSFALLRLPRMPEIKHKAGVLDGFTPSAIDPSSVRFRDKAREKQRQVAMQRQKRDVGGPRCPSATTTRAMPVKLHAPAAKRRKLQDKEDLDELARDYRLLKRLKKGKLTASEFDTATDPCD